MKRILSLLMVFTLALLLIGTSKTLAYATGSNMFDQTTVTSRTPYESGSEYWLQLPPPASGAYSLDNNNISNADIGLLENVEYTLSATGKGFGGEINLRLTIWYVGGTLDSFYTSAYGLTDERLSVTFTPDSGKVVDRIVLSGGNVGSHDLLIRKDSIMIEEGSTMSPYIAFGEVHEVINLYRDGYLDEIHDWGDGCVDYMFVGIPVDTNTDYTFSIHTSDAVKWNGVTLWIEGNNSSWISEDEDFSGADRLDEDMIYHTFNTGTNDEILKIKQTVCDPVLANEMLTNGVENMQLEKGIVASDYVAYVVEVPSITSTSAVIYSDIENPYTLAQINATVTAEDNQDGDLTSSLIIDASDFIGNEATLGTYSIDYSVIDSDGHTTVFSLQVRVVDVDIPVITLIGAPTINIEFGGTYTEPGANTIDNVDGVMNEVISGNVNISVLGTYQVIYSATDSSGHDAIQRTRTVIVEDTTAPTLTGDTTLNLFATETRTPEELIDEEFTTNDLHGITASYIEDDFYTGNETVPGTYTFDIVLSDSSGNDFAQTITIVVTEDAAPVITTTLPIMTIEEADALTPEELRALFGK